MDVYKLDEELLSHTIFQVNTINDLIVDATWVWIQSDVLLYNMCKTSCILIQI